MFNAKINHLATCFSDIVINAKIAFASNSALSQCETFAESLFVLDTGKSSVLFVVPLVNGL